MENFNNNNNNQSGATRLRFDPIDVRDNKIFAAIGYLGVLCFIPLILIKGSKYAEFHGKQGFVLFVAELIIFFFNVVPFIGWLISIFAGLAVLCLSLIGLIKALYGEAWEIPFLAEYAKKVNI